MIEEIYEIFQKCRKISIDSRIVSRGSIFFALKGENFDGNDFVENALKSGCVAAVASDPKYLGVENVFVVEDTLKTLQQLSNYHRRKLGIPIIGITGTNGKTTTKELISSVLAKKFRISYTQGNKNNHIGVPLTLLSMNRTVDIGVVEMGASHLGEIKELCDIVEPNYGLITNVGKAHLEGFGSLEGVMKTKGELYDYIKAKKGVIFINRDNDILNTVLGDSENTNIVTYGTSDNDYCRGVYSEYGFQAVVTWKTDTASGSAKSNLIGEYNFENILAAITLGNYFDIHETAIDNSIADYFPKNNRSQLLKTTRNTLILDLYNANPSSMMAAISNFNKISDEHKTLILGDMLELGKDSLDEHKKVLDYIQKSGYEKVFLVGKNFLNFKTDYKYSFFESVDDLAKYFIRLPEKSRVFLVKASRGILLERCIDYL